MVDRRQSLLMECVQHNEFTHVAADCSIRPTRRIVGQEDYIVSKEKRNDAAIGDDEAIRKILNCRGRTGAVACMIPMRDEQTKTMAEQHN